MGSSKMVSGIHDVSINVLELLGMVVGAQVLITQQQFAPQEMGDCIQMRGDNKPSVAWIQRWRGGKEPRSGAIMRMLGVIECPVVGYFNHRMCPVCSTLSLTVFPAGTLLTFTLTCVRLHHPSAGRRWS